jgi:uncharacterized protein YeaO (DUF488 family)
MAKTIKLKRAYETPEPADGLRILVDRLWPRGVSKEAAAIDHWYKEVAPSTKLRLWFGHDPALWAEFGERYRHELAEKRGQLDELRAHTRKGPVTLVYAARDTAHNHAIVLRDVLLKR